MCDHVLSFCLPLPVSACSNVLKSDAVRGTWDFLNSAIGYLSTPDEDELERMEASLEELREQTHMELQILAEDEAKYAAFLLVHRIPGFRDVFLGPLYNAGCYGFCGSL